MAYLVVCITALLASILTLFSGFGLGTILLPAFALFFPAPLAVALTAVVHLLNNLFKLALLGRHADARVALRFGLPALCASFLGAALLGLLASRGVIHSWSLGDRRCDITIVNIVIAALMILFSIVELTSAENRAHIPPRFLPLGGLLSGFIGGLSGHQGALRTAFLLHAGLNKNSFIATGVVIACLVDVARLAVYSTSLPVVDLRTNAPLLAASVFSAFVGAFLGARLMNKITLRFVQVLVAVLLILLAIALASGLLSTH